MPPTIYSMYPDVVNIDGLESENVISYMFLSVIFYHKHLNLWIAVWKCDVNYEASTWGLAKENYMLSRIS